jgi:hypothetical protein
MLSWSTSCRAPRGAARSSRPTRLRRLAKLWRQELHVREAAVGAIVLLQFDRGGLGQRRARRHLGDEPIEKSRVVCKRLAERGRHVVLVVPEQVEHGLDRAVMQYELRHARTITRHDTRDGPIGSVGLQA